MSRSKRLAFIHVLRAVAAAVVVWVHLVEGTAWWPGDAAYLAGHGAVAVFFVVSGFVAPLALGDRGASAYLLGRLVRLWPVWAAGVTIAAVTSYAAGRVEFGAVDLAAAYLPGLGDLLGVAPVTPVVWTLETEARFCLLAAAVAPWLRAADTRCLVVVPGGLLVAGMAAAPFGRLGGEVVAECGYLALIWSGVALNFWYRGAIQGDVTAVAVAACLVVASVCLCSGPLAAWWWVLLPAEALGVVAFAVCLAGRDEFDAGGPAGWLAEVSYSLYASHRIPGRVLVAELLAAGVPVGGAVAAAASVCLAIAAVVWWLIEQPTRRLAARLSKPERSSVPLVAARQGAGV